MNKVLNIIFVLMSTFVFSQDVIIQNGNFRRCAPDRFFDSGGENSNYSSNENFTTTICPQNAGGIIILDFTEFSTQLDTDILSIYDGDSTASPLIGMFSGTNSPGRVVASSASGCLTITFTSNDSGNTIGWAANIICTVPCQTITANIDSTVPSAIPPGVIEIIPTQTVTFNGSATFSNDPANASYLWDFGDGSTANTQNTSHQFNTPGTFTVRFQVTDNNPVGCSALTSITVVVTGSIVTINNPIFPESSFNPEELISEVLVSGGCSDVDNFGVQVAGNPTDLMTKSYGYFTRGGTNFPFEEGIVLSTGMASQGGNQINFGQISSDNGLPNDTDLETALGIVGSMDATFIQFTFTPTTNNISFRYIMASEEYDMNFECFFTDGFAFLLREVGTTAFTNLAVLPDNTPVNVTNINNAPDCAANTEFFAGYNLGATNYGGRTEVLIASAEVIPNTTYEIKLVIADEGDMNLDSAIFIEAGSFNLGGELGEDITLAAGTAECDGEIVILDTQAPSATHTWFRDGVEIIGETQQTLEVTEPGMYSVDVMFAPGCETSDSILVEFRNSPIISEEPRNFSACSPSGVATFNLEQNTPLVFGTQDPMEFELTYHNSLEDAETDVNPITDINTYTGSDGEVIFIRIDDIVTQTCVVTTSFILNVFTSVASEAVTFGQCDDALDGDDTNGITTFDLSTINSQVLGIQDATQFTVSYHISSSDADVNNNPLPNLYTNISPNTQQIYARVQNNNNIDCFGTSTITLMVNQLPTITPSVTLRQCDNDTDGFSDFNLTEANTLISSNSSNEVFSYYTTLTDANTATNVIQNPSAYTNIDASSNSDVLYVRVETVNGCFRVAQLELLVSTTQIPQAFELVYEACDDRAVDNDINNGVTSFDFSNATAQILALYPAGQDITVTYYETTADALAELNAIPDISNHRNDNSPFNQSIIVRVDSNIDNACLGFGEHITLRTINPVLNTNLEDIVLCDDVAVGDLSEVFDLTLNETFIFNGNVNLTASYYLSMANALADVAPIANPSTYSNTNATETIYVRVLDNISGCFTVVDFDIMVNPLPDIMPITDIEVCENDTDMIFDFDLSVKTPEILNGQDPFIFSVSYYTSESDADNLSNPIGNIFTNTTNPQQIFVAVTNTLTNCSISTQSFSVEVMEGARANPDGIPLVFELCDDPLNDGIEQFDLLQLEEDILDDQNPSEYTITYHNTLDDANNNVEPIPTLFENSTNPQNVYVRVSNNLAPDICFEVAPITLMVNPIPEFDIEDSYILCITSNGTEVIEVPPLIDTGLSATDFSFEWSLNGAVLPTEIGPSLIPTQGGIYNVIVTDITTSTITRCSSMDSTEVIESELPILSAQVTTQAFANSHTIQANAEGVGIYEFSLDNGPWQDSGVFENVSGGTHAVFARDINGCGITSTNVLVIDYPLYFTPNGDGNHDQWNIIGIDTLPNAKIYIFDRYGKLLKQLSPTDSGWDGTYRGNLMPTDDYWFRVEYTEPLTGEEKQQSAHFTLKR